MPTISGTITLPDSVTTVDGAFVAAHLVASVVGNPPGFNPTAGVTIVSDVTATTKKNGQWSLVLTNNALITPAGTCYRFTYRIPGAASQSFYKVVGASDANVLALADAVPLTYPPESQIGAGDVTGPYGANTVTGLRGRPMSAAAPNVGDAPVWSGSQWAPGPAGGGGASVFSWSQSPASVTWAIVHNLGHHPPSVTVIDGSGNVLTLFDRSDPDLNHTTLTFASAVAGIAYLI